jgi:hypothetical protein
MAEMECDHEYRRRCLGRLAAVRRVVHSISS